MIEYRPFQNFDPPGLAALWEACRLGRAAASPMSPDVLETVNFSQAYFDPRGLIVACEGRKIVGFVHAGFGRNAESNALACSAGVICAVLVHPDFRRQGIGRRLVSLAESYLQSAGAESILAGPACPRDPFYVGAYGGSRPAGFFDSDPDAARFFPQLGYEPGERFLSFERDISQPRDPVNMRVMSLRRKMQIVAAHHPEAASWWWFTRYGRLDSLQFYLVPKEGAAVAEATATGLDFYLQKWRERAVGITGLFVREENRRKGFAQTLLLDLCKRLRAELITRVEINVPEHDVAAVALLQTSGFQPVDAGTVYRRRNDV